MTLAQIVGSKIRFLREESGHSQDDVARAARDCGLSWGRTTVAQVEAGTKYLSAEELVLLPLVLLRAFNVDLSVPELVTPIDIDPSGEWVELGKDARLTYTAVVELLSGERSASGIHDAIADTPGRRARRAADKAVQERARELRARLSPSIGLHTVIWAMRDASGEAEQKAARRLGVQADEVAVAAHRLWKRGLTAQRDALVEEAAPEEADRRSIQALRGHVTRQLLEQLAPIIEEST